MNPENSNPQNFSVISILYNNDEFSVAYGTWENGNKCIAMRWNGEEDEAGYPKVFGHPMWFLIDNELKLPILKSLLHLPNSNNELILKTLTEEI